MSYLAGHLGRWQEEAPQQETPNELRLPTRWCDTCRFLRHAYISSATHTLCCRRESRTASQNWNVGNNLCNLAMPGI